MHKNGWRPFWAALGAALLVLLPLVGGTVLLTRQMVRTRIQTAQPQSGVPIQLPRAEHRMTLLLCTAGEQPGFLLVYLNAAQNKEAHALLSGWDADGTLPPARRAAARAAVWEAFFRQDLALLPATLPDALRASSTALLTDFAAQDYTLLGTVLEFLANNSALPHAEALPGAWDAKAGTYTVTDASRAAVQTFLSVSPASGNDASLREP